MDNSTGHAATGTEPSVAFLIDSLKVAQRSERGWVYLYFQDGTWKRPVGSAKPYGSGITRVMKLHSSGDLAAHEVDA